MKWLYCYYCNSSYGTNQFHDCNTPDDFAPGYGGSSLSTEPKIFVAKNHMYNCIDIELYVPVIKQRFGARFTLEYIAYQTLSNLFAKMCEMFSVAVAADPRVKTLLRNTVLGEDFAYINVNGDIYNSWPADTSYEINVGLGRQREIDYFPGIKAQVKYPGKKPTYAGLTMTLEDAIIKLNDYDKWTREQIADWLETLDVDIRFKPKENDDEQVG